MGYYTNVSGELAIEPPIEHKQLKEKPEFTSWDLGIIRVRVDETEAEQETDQGTVTIVTRAGVAVEAWEDSVRAYDIADELQAIVDAFPGREWTGYLSGEGQENDDMWRLYVRNGRAIKVKAQIVWNEPA